MNCIKIPIFASEGITTCRFYKIFHLVCLLHQGLGVEGPRDVLRDVDTPKDGCKVKRCEGGVFCTPVLRVSKLEGVQGGWKAGFEMSPGLVS